MKPNRATNALEGLVGLMNLQEERVRAMWEVERKSGLMNPALDRTIRALKKLLLNILQLLFDLGLEHCKRRTPWEHTVMVETRRAEQQAKIAEAYVEAKKFIAECLAEKRKADAHLKERTTDAETRGVVDSDESVGSLSLVEPIRAVSILDRLADLSSIQDQRVLTLTAQGKKLGFINPRLDNAISLHTELLLSYQGVAFDLAIDRYHRRTPREQVDEYYEQEQRNQRITYEAYKGAKEMIKEWIEEHGSILLPKYRSSSAEAAESSVEPSATAEEDERDVP